MALQAVIFDLDGTLLDTNGLHTEAWLQALEASGFRFGRDRVAIEIGKGGDKFVPSLLGDAIEAQDGEALREEHGERYRTLIRTHAVEVFPKVRALFEALHKRGLQVAVATASKKENLELVLEQAGIDLDAYADAVVSDSDVERSKPHPDVVEAAVRKLGCSPAACLMVGDTPYDVQAARRAGVACIGVTAGSAHQAEALMRVGARAVYANLAELLDQLDDALAQASPTDEVLTRERLQQLMGHALDMAQTALEAGEVPIGSLLARYDGTVLGRGHNRAHSRGSRVAHAELEAFRAAEPLPANARDCILVTTLEPCVMCLGAAMEVRVDTVVYALEAPSNGGAERCDAIQAPGAFMPRLVGGVRRDESRRLLESWAKAHPEDAFVQDLLERTRA